MAKGGLESKTHWDLHKEWTPHKHDYELEEY